jgi:hypothetical protein
MKPLNTFLKDISAVLEIVFRELFSKAAEKDSRCEFGSFCYRADRQQIRLMKYSYNVQQPFNHQSSFTKLG